MHFVSFISRVVASMTSVALIFREIILAVVRSCRQSSFLVVTLCRELSLAVVLSCPAIFCAGRFGSNNETLQY